MTNATDYLKKLQSTVLPGGPPPKLRVWRRDPRAKLPIRSSDGAVGLDIFAFLLTETGRATSSAVHQKATTLVPTGITVIPPPGYYVKIVSRSGLAKKGVFVANAPGIIDPDYTGELMILLFNGSHETHYVSHEHRIAQLVLSTYLPSEVEEAETPPGPTQRGEGGFGSTGN